VVHRGSKNHLIRLDQWERARRRSPSVALSFFYSLVRRILEVLRVHCMGAAAKNAEILARHHSLVKKRRTYLHQGPGAGPFPTRASS
jgi:hypothetical protein